MRFHERSLTNADVANYLRHIKSDLIHFTENRIHDAIMSGDHYGLKIVLDSPIVLSDFLDGIGYPIDGATSICLSVVIAHKDDGYLEHGASVAQYLLNQLLGISATQLIFSGEGSSAQIVLDEMMYIDWSFFNKIYKSH